MFFLPRGPNYSTTCRVVTRSHFDSINSSSTTSTIKIQIQLWLQQKLKSNVWESELCHMLSLCNSGPQVLKVCLCYRVDMKHRFRRDLIRGETESTMSKQKLQQRMREQWVHTHTHTPERTVTCPYSEPGVFQVPEVDGGNSVVGAEQRQEEER